MLIVLTVWFSIVFLAMCLLASFFAIGLVHGANA